MKKWLDGATVLLTGASSGIGRELAHLLVTEHGCTVVGMARSEEKLRAVASELGERFIPYVFDVTEAGAWDALGAWLDDDAGAVDGNGKRISPDILINNAGVLPKFAAFPGGDGASGLRRVLDVNFFPQVESYVAMLPRLCRSGRPGIVNIASSAALASLPGTAAYTASKAASLAFTECVALERRDIYIAAVCPGYTRTPLFDSQRGGEKLISLIAMEPRRMAKKIVRRICRRRRKIVCGVDAHVMSVLHRVGGTPALDIFSAFIRRFGGDLFSDVFPKDNGKDKE